MHLEDVLKFFNRLGVRLINDVTAQVAAEVTAAMDPKGMGVHMGADAPSVDIEMATKTELIAQMSSIVTKVQFETNMSGIVDTFGLIKDSLEGIGKSMVVGNESVMNVLQVVTLKCAEVKQYVDGEVLELREKTDKKMKVMKKNIESKMQAKDEERDAKDEERDAKDAERDKLLASLQRASGKEKKRPADNQGEGTSQKKKRKTEPMYIFKDPNSNGFMWRRYFNGIMHRQDDFNTIEEAVKDIAEYFENLAP